MEIGYNPIGIYSAKRLRKCIQFHTNYKGFGGLKLEKCVRLSEEGHLKWTILSDMRQIIYQN